jgi:DNA-binding transcriptional regulator YdaS (Cro superfamily)
MANGGRPPIAARDDGKRAVLAACSAAQLARLLGISPASISLWRRVPAERVIEVERVTGISRHVIRPDLYPL